MENTQSLTQKQTLPLLVAMMPSPGLGHLIPTVEFAKRLVVLHNLAVTIVIPSDAPPSKAQTTILHSLPTSISHIFLPPVSLSDLPMNTQPEPIIAQTILRSLPSLRETFNSFMASHTLVAFIVDHFGTDTFTVAREFNVPSYIFHSSNALSLSFLLHLPQLDEEVHSEYRDLAEPIKLPGCVPVHGKDLPDPVQDRKNDSYKWLLHHSKLYRLAEGILVNSFMDLESGALNEFQKVEPGRPPVYPIGPLVNMGNIHNNSIVDGSECLKWLDDQPRGSVLFVSFGSGGTLSSAQLNELAHGLEMSGQRFLWVVRSPNDKVANAFFSNAESQTDPYGFFPKGFVERTRGRGLLVPSWAPQAQVLSHRSTGGFLTHCGWNSILESVVNGVPLVVWPLHAEQKMNAILLTQDIKVALRPKVSENGLVERKEIAKIVKGLMESEEGNKVRFRMKELKEVAASALNENGSSTNQISHLVLAWNNKKMGTN